MASAPATGFVAVEKVEEKSTVTRCFSKYPLKLIVPNKVGYSSRTDAVWICSLSYGGSIVSGDCISVGLSIGDGCTAAVTTQASTKIFHPVLGCAPTRGKKRRWGELAREGCGLRLWRRWSSG